MRVPLACLQLKAELTHLCALPVYPAQLVMRQAEVPERVAGDAEFGRTFVYDSQARPGVVVMLGSSYMNAFLQVKAMGLSCWWEGHPGQTCLAS